MITKCLLGARHHAVTFQYQARYVSMVLALFTLTILTSAADLRADDEWGKGITIKTSWKEAIAECKATGKLLFIYNGWQNKNI